MTFFCFRSYDLPIWPWVHPRSSITFIIYDHIIYNNHFKINPSVVDVGIPIIYLKINSDSKQWIIKLQKMKIYTRKINYFKIKWR